MGNNLHFQKGVCIAVVLLCIFHIDYIVRERVNILPKIQANKQNNNKEDL